MRHGCGPQRSFSVSSNAHNGSVGSTGFHSHITTAACHAKTRQFRQAKVRKYHVLIYIRNSNIRKFCNCLPNHLSSYSFSPIMRKYQQQYIKQNGFDDYVMEQAMLNSGQSGTSNMIPGYLPPPPLPPLSENDLDVDIGYKSLPPLPTFNGKSEFGGLDGSTCGSDQDYKFDTCELHGKIEYPLGGFECPEIYRALDGVRYIAESTKREEESCKVKEDWKYVAMVMDRLFLWIFTIAVLVGSAGIILQAPALYDTREAIDVELSEIEAATVKPPDQRGMSIFV